MFTISYCELYNDITGYTLIVTRGADTLAVVVEL